MTKKIMLPNKSESRTGAPEFSVGQCRMISTLITPNSQPDAA
jgi:hypothetical protein